MIFMALDANGKVLPKGITWKADKKLYMARFTFQGQSYTFYEKTLAAAKKTLENKKYEVEHGIQGKADKLTLNGWYEIWFHDYKLPLLRETSLESYERMYRNHIKESIGSKKLSQIKPLHIQQLYNSMLSEGLKAGTINNIAAMLYNIFKIAVSNELIPRNPCESATRPKNQKKEQRVLSIEEENTLLQYLKNDKWKMIEPLIVVLLKTGMRSGEAFGLTWDDVNFSTKEISINKALVYVKDRTTGKHTFKFQPPKTEAGNRVIPMQPEVEAALKRQSLFQKKMKLYIGSEWKPTSGFENMVFTSHQGVPWHKSDIRTYLNTIVKNINSQEQELAAKENREPVIMEHVHTHTFRHTFATRCSEAGVSPKAVQYLLGHADIGLTMNLYTHITKEQAFSEIKKLNGTYN